MWTQHVRSNDIARAVPQSAQAACRRFKLPVDMGYTCDLVVCGVSRKPGSHEIEARTSFVDGPALGRILGDLEVDLRIGDVEQFGGRIAEEDLCAAEFLRVGGHRIGRPALPRRRREVATVDGEVRSWYDHPGGSGTAGHPGSNKLRRRTGTRRGHAKKR